jgi:hypothetical protein
MLIDDIDADKLEQAVRDMEKLLDADPERFKKKCLAQAKILTYPFLCGK